MPRQVVFAVLTLLCFGCGGGGSGAHSPSPSVQGGRILGMDVKETPSISYATAYARAIAIGVREVSVSLDWSLLEPSLGDHDDTLPGIIDVFYPGQPADLALVLRPLDTPGPSLPAELIGLPYDDPAVIAAFEDFLTHLHAQLPALNASGRLRWIHIGNEIDAHLGQDATRWAQWRTFFRAAKAKVRELWGSGVEVGSIVQFSVLNDATKRALYMSLLPDLDNAVLTYYPLDADFTVRPVSAVASDFALMVDTIPDKAIVLQECGYPSSALNDSSEAKQADFISAVFEAWDEHASRIRLIDLTWQYDVTPATVDQWVVDYRMAGSPDEAAFRAYLATLGLHRGDGAEKMAMQRLRDELLARGWDQ